MGSSPLLILLVLFLSVSSYAKLTKTYYEKSCPRFEEIVRDAAISKQVATPTTAAGTLRVFFHDCMVSGCDASLLVASSAHNKAERDADLNINLPGDAFDVITRAKANLELTCPGVVSCSDILAQVTRDLIKLVGGPFYEVRLGRKDALFSKASDVDGKLPTQQMTMEQVFALFASRGFTIEELVALLGSHTIGFAHCKEFADRIFNHSPTSDVDPSLNPEFAKGLKSLCANYKTDNSMAAFMDVVTPGTFDNMYYQNMKRGLGLLTIDQKLMSNPKTRPFAERFAANQTEFFKVFAHSIEKVSRLDIKIGNEGEVRHRCDAFNTKQV